MCVCVFGVFLVCVCVFSVFLMCFWYVFNVFVMCCWCVFGVFLVSKLRGEMGEGGGGRGVSVGEPRGDLMGEPGGACNTALPLEIE